MLLLLNNAVITAHTRIITAAARNQTGSVVMLLSLMPKVDRAMLVKLLENAIWKANPMSIPITITGIFVISVLLMSSCDV